MQYTFAVSDGEIEDEIATPADGQETTEDNLPEDNLPDDDSADMNDDEFNNNENLANVSK